MGSETVIQSICLKNSCGLFLRDCVTIKLERHCLLIHLCFAHCLIFFLLLLINIVAVFTFIFLVTPGS